MIGGVQQNQSGTYRAHFRREGKHYEAGSYATREQAELVLRRVSKAIASGMSTAAAIESHAVRQRVRRGTGAKAQGVRLVRQTSLVPGQFHPSPLDLLIAAEQRMFAADISRRMPLLAMLARGMNYQQIGDELGQNSRMARMKVDQEINEARRRGMEVAK